MRWGRVVVLKGDQESLSKSLCMAKKEVREQARQLYGGKDLQAEATV